MFPEIEVINVFFFSAFESTTELVVDSVTDPSRESNLMEFINNINVPSSRGCVISHIFSSSDATKDERICLKIIIHSLSSLL
jgi:hypothetical protein